MSTSSKLAGKVCIVTGATRGIGKGIALQLAKNGATVYITGRTLDHPQDSKVGGCLRDTAGEIEAKGRGKCIPVQCDHSNDDDIKNLFNRVSREQDGQLDVLVNNAYSAVDTIFSYFGTKFWKQPLSMWDEVNNVGLRNHYICSIYAANMMVQRKRGLIVNVSSSGGIHYVLNPPYGIGKAACDRMAADCAVELRESNVAFVSLWPGFVATEKILDIQSTGNAAASNLLNSFPTSETPEFAGMCVASLACDSNLMAKSGKILITAELGDEYGLRDMEGHKSVNMRQVNNLVRLCGPRWSWLAWIIPNFLKVPKSVLAIANSKF